MSVFQERPGSHVSFKERFPCLRIARIVDAIARGAAASLAAIET